MYNLVPKEEFKKRLIKITESAITQDKKVERFKDMLLDCSNYGDNYVTNPGEMSFEIKSTGEPAYQRAILESEKILLNFKKDNGFATISRTVQWIDGELPVVLNKNPRRPCIDLIGLLDENLVICELKFSKNKSYSDSPVYAVIELLTYYCFIQFNAVHLDKYNVYHKNLEPFKWNVIDNGFTRLIVCANEYYWDACWTKLDKAKLSNQVSEWGELLGASINLFQSKNFDFELQKGDKEKYTPSILTNSTWEII